MLIQQQDRCYYTIDIINVKGRLLDELFVPLIVLNGNKYAIQYNLLEKLSSKYLKDGVIEDEHREAQAQSTIC